MALVALLLIWLSTAFYSRIASTVNGFEDAPRAPGVMNERSRNVVCYPA